MERSDQILKEQENQPEEVEREAGAVFLPVTHPRDDWNVFVRLEQFLVEWPDDVASYLPAACRCFLSLFSAPSNSSGSANQVEDNLLC